MQKYVHLADLVKSFPPIFTTIYLQRLEVIQLIHSFASFLLSHAAGREVARAAARCASEEVVRGRSAGSRAPLPPPGRAQGARRVNLKKKR